MTAVAGYKKEFASFIKDKIHPLDERWAMFIDAPDYLKEYLPLIQHFDAFKVFHHDHRNQLEDNLLVDSDVNKGTRVDMSEWDLHFLENCLGLNEDGDQWVANNGKKFTKKIYDAWREEVLAKNLGSFCFDW